MRERWWIDPEVNAQLGRVAPLDVARWSSLAAEAKWLSSDRQSAAALVDGPVPLFVKWRRTERGRRRKTFGRASRERREARAYLRLAALGVKAPVPWAVGERRRGGVLVAAVLVRPFHEGCRDGREVGQGDPARLQEIARHLRTWHDVGFRHGDCYPKNVLVPDSGAPPFPLGCPAARFRGRGPKMDRRRRRDLAQWAVGMQAIDPGGSPFAFLDAYCAAPGLPAPARLEAAIRPHFDRILQKQARRLATRDTREPDGPPRPTPLEPSDAPKVHTRPLRGLVEGHVP